MEYVRLTDKTHSNTVVRMKGQKQNMFDAWTRKWYRTAMMIDYFCDESDKYDMYVEITENEARAIVETQGGDLFAEAYLIG